MYDFCPLDLYSGDQKRVMASIESLLRDPHRNLRIFVDGNVVHDEKQVLSRERLSSLCFPTLAVSAAGDGVGLLVSVVRFKKKYDKFLYFLSYFRISLVLYFYLFE